jgi:hypothetical protein
MFLKLLGTNKKNYILNVPCVFDILSIDHKLRWVLQNVSVFLLLEQLENEKHKKES